MNGTVLRRAAALLALTAAPAAAQSDTVLIGGYDALKWGATYEQVTAYWRETPQSEERHTGMRFLRMADFEGMEWTLGVHDRDGFANFVAMAPATLPAGGCEPLFDNLVNSLGRLYSALPRQGAKTNPGGGNLCEAVKAGRATASIVWSDPRNGAKALVFIDPNTGRVAWGHMSRAFGDWYAAATSAPAAPSASAPSASAPVASAPARSGALAGLDGRLWHPAEAELQVPFGTPGATIRQIFGEPFREDREAAGPGMVDLIYTHGGQGLVFTVHETKGMIRASRTTGLVGPGEPCSAFWNRMVAVASARMPGVTPAGGPANAGSGDLCESVIAGRAFAEMVWTDPASGAMLALRIGPQTGVISLATISPDYQRWFDSTATGRERAERIRRAGQARP